MNAIPILSTIPRSGTWFLRYSISFLCHLEHGGRIDDRLTGMVVGNQSGPVFDFHHFKGGPLFRVRGTLPTEHLFIGHTVCPGFGDVGSTIDWWRRTAFHVPGYDYLHEGMDYECTPVELAPYGHAPVSVPQLERLASKGFGQPIVLVYRNPIDQAASYYRYCRDHTNPAYNTLKGQPLASVSFSDYLFESGLPSYAKQFFSFQAMAEKHPGLVRLVPYERLMSNPVGMMTEILNHLSGVPKKRPRLGDALWLARPEHMKAVEKELGRSLDGTQGGRRSHIRQADIRRSDRRLDNATYDRVMAVLRDYGLDLDLFDWPAGGEAVSAA